jgi:N-hydroxyarylamine O-acetyltransferase
MLTVPFENLDIHLHVPIVLDEEKFFEKVVFRHRGGFCYELNGLFAALLRSLGFNVTLLSGRVFSDGTPGPEFDHMALLVELEDRWLADVGFGDSFVEPLRLDDPLEQEQRGAAYRIQNEREVLTLSERQRGKDWTPSYQFTLRPHALADFSAMCQWQQTAPESHFRQKRICSLATPDGRVTLSDSKLITTRNGQKEERFLSEQEYNVVLRQHFGFEL